MSSVGFATLAGQEPLAPAVPLWQTAGPSSSARAAPVERGLCRCIGRGCATCRRRGSSGPAALAAGACVGALAARGSKRAGKTKSAVAAVKEREQALVVAEGGEHAKTSFEVLVQLAKGNNAFCEQLRTTGTYKAGTKVDKLAESFMKPPPKAIVLSCSKFDAPLDALFGAQTGELCSVRVLGNTCGRADSIVSSIEYELSSDQPPVLLVLGNSMNEAV
eukprot:CAMPEP_0203843900 /NCGR_PEP_ID=MMETSP0359-20131031/2862_1 /ASSEMBLY_ACC=CAM_ASM_000338 /TAXON_ID=268821 /ORGANISM="Scrippsiella Hangoei, Strain SHTV-5" /LENGTH=218 /DNA_ID=CAMNT_0050758737 /DNA_START=33 /DNA_END=686 /DNA_ORIENTATION=+